MRRVIHLFPTPEGRRFALLFGIGFLLAGQLTSNCGVHGPAPGYRTVLGHLIRGYGDAWLACLLPYVVYLAGRVTLAGTPYLSPRSFLD